jgi:hypothetical protein
MYSFQRTKGMKGGNEMTDKKRQHLNDLPSSQHKRGIDKIQLTLKTFFKLWNSRKRNEKLLAICNTKLIRMKIAYPLLESSYFNKDVDLSSKKINLLVTRFLSYPS